MRLRKVSSWFFAVVLLVLGANAMFIVLITKSYDSVVATQKHRQIALGLANELHQETEQLARLVRAYTATGEPRYLLYYYDILAIRQGEKAVPTNFNPNSYWDDVIAGRIKHDIPKDGNKRSVADLMKSTGFSDPELLALKRVLDATAAMNKIEQKAFAATQGLYNPETEEFVSDGPARLDFASLLVHSNAYNALKADLSTAVDGLVTMTDRRTSAEVAAAGERLERWILLSLVSMGATIVMAVLALRVIRRDVLVPIHRLGRGADRLAAGDYATRTGALRGFDELTALGRTVDSMAQAIEDDIGRSHAVQKELEIARKQAEDATHAKSMFLANMSHEIRTPMNAILGMAYLALRTGLNTRQHDYVTKIHDAAKSLLGIINDILDFSKVEAGKLELDEGRFRIEDVAGNSLSLLRQRAHEKDIELLFDVTESRLLGESGALMGDALRLGQVITNLLSNAVKFTHQGYVKLMVGIERVDVDSLTLLFTVRDTGIGMTEEQIGRLFQEFTQADGSTTRKYGGTGLGLTISKRIVELMGGRIWVQSVSGQGSSLSFTARFPFTQPPAAPSAPLPRADAMRVLVVDDQPDARLALQDLLGALGVGTAHQGRVDCSDDGDTALVMIEQARQRGQPYDLLLIDWVMPLLDGAGVLKALQDKPGVGTPLPVIVSAYDSELLHATAKALGAEHFLPKPVLPESLRELIKWLAGDGATDAGSSPAAATNTDLGGLRVLLVEDNAINQQLAVELMESRGVQVDVASNGQDGIDRIHANSPSYYGVVLMDLQMPVMDGYEATRLLRLDARYVNLPIIAMTAHAMADERQRCLVLGMNGHLSKPIDPDTLYNTLATFDAGTAETRPGPVTAPATLMAVAEHGESPAAPQFSGLDTQLGLRHAGGNLRLYSQLLRRFASDFSGFATRVESMLANENWDAAEREAHTLKGLCATLGASAIHPLAAGLEKAILARNRDSVVEKLAGTGVAVDAMTSALHAQFAIDDASAYDTKVPFPTQDVSDGVNAPALAFDQWLAHLRDLLRNGDDEARDVWHAGSARIDNALPVDVVDRVTRALSNYQFDEVLDLLPKPHPATPGIANSGN
jgi:two-component system sensor histidine kinase/response regulator